jgi:hypothetical protein
MDPRADLAGNLRDIRHIHLIVLLQPSPGVPFPFEPLRQRGLADESGEGVSFLGRNPDRISVRRAAGDVLP